MNKKTDVIFWTVIGIIVVALLAVTVLVDHRSNTIPAVPSTVAPDYITSPQTPPPQTPCTTKDCEKGA